VLYALSLIAYAKADHIEASWRDIPLAAEWLRQAHRLDKFAKDTRGAMA
jgi:hypothetical protein